jgi:hypothetical protein
MDLEIAVQFLHREVDAKIGIKEKNRNTTKGEL